MSGPVSDPKRRALGRGLDALLPAARDQAPSQYGDKSVFSCALCDAASIATTQTIQHSKKPEMNTKTHRVTRPKTEKAKVSR